MMPGWQQGRPSRWRRRCRSCWSRRHRGPGVPPNSNLRLQILRWQGDCGRSGLRARMQQKMTERKLGEESPVAVKMDQL